MQPVLITQFLFCVLIDERNYVGIVTATWLDFKNWGRLKNCLYSYQLPFNLWGALSPRHYLSALIYNIKMIIENTLMSPRLSDSCNKRQSCPFFTSTLWSVMRYVCLYKLLYNTWLFPPLIEQHAALIFCRCALKPQSSVPGTAIKLSSVQNKVSGSRLS